MHPLDAVGAVVLPVSALDTAGSCVLHSCMSQGMSASATTPRAHICASRAVTWACQYRHDPHPQRAPRVPALCCSPRRLLWAAGIPRASCPDLPHVLDGLVSLSLSSMSSLTNCQRKFSPPFPISGN